MNSLFRDEGGLNDWFGDPTKALNRFLF